MEIPGVKSAMPSGAEPRKNTRRKGIRWRKGLRLIHRDLGYFVVGLTLVYALSGLAVNHIDDWEPNFRQVRSVYQLEVPLPSAVDDIAARAAMAAGRGHDTIRETYSDEEGTLEVALDRGSLRVDLKTGQVLEERQEPRFFLRVANWLHLNRGKTAWTVIADGYAIILLVLACTGLLMFPGRKGIFGRAGLVALAGAMVPALYVTLSGGP